MTSWKSYYYLLLLLLWLQLHDDVQDTVRIHGLTHVRCHKLLNGFLLLLSNEPRAMRSKT